MGLALPALAGDLLPERTPGEAAGVLTVRHAGIAVALAVLAPLISDRLDAAIQRGREREVAVLLDARLGPAKKIGLVGPLLGELDERNPRTDLRRAFSRAETGVSGSDRAELRRAARRADETITIAVREAFGPAFLVTAAFALLAAALLAPDLTAPRRLLYPALAALAVPAAMVALSLAVRPSPVELRDPCQGRDLPGTGGLFGFAQDFALRQLDRVACRLGSTREELVLALADEKDARRFEREHGSNPRSVTSFLRALVP
jgi:hypothetical protein